MDTLPAEIIIQIALFLDPVDIVALQHVCKKFLVLGRDNTLWREQCFLSSSFLEKINRRRALLTAGSLEDSRFQYPTRALANGNGLGNSRLIAPREEARDKREKFNEKVRIRANWDPSYPNEEVRWYDEYIVRNAPISTNWLQQPRNRESIRHEYLEIRGMCLYTELGDAVSTMVVAPLDDGSLCVWDIAGTKGRKGSIIARSKSGVLYPSPDGSPNQSNLISAGVTECISVDAIRKTAYIAIQNELVEIDLRTLQPISRKKFPCIITALSEAKYPVPLTVGTNLSLHLHDPRTQISPSHILGDTEHLDHFSEVISPIAKQRDFRSWLDPKLNPLYTYLPHSGPLSILHLPSDGEAWNGDGDIYAAGRFPSILNYDRRYFPKLRGTIHSGARLCSMASLPYPFSSIEQGLSRRGELSVEQIWEAKTRPGKTLIACGEYKSKGSLEMYGLSPNPYLSTISSNPLAGSIQTSVMKNRQTSSSSKLFSVSNHGTRIVVSDGSGNLKWLERDGSTEARRWNIQGSAEAPQGVFGIAEDSYLDFEPGGIIIKLSSTHNGRTDRPVNDDGLMIWTGEKLGLLAFSSKPGSTSESFEEKTPQTTEEEYKERQEHNYTQIMRKALEANADEVRFMSGLGLGLGYR